MGFRSKTITVPVPRSLNKEEYEDVVRCLEFILNGESFFYAGKDEVSTEVALFVREKQIMTNLEEIVEG